MAERYAPQGKLDVAAVSDLHSWLVASKGQDIVLDLKDVSLFGALCLQCCLVGARSAHAAGHSFEIIGASNAVLSQLSGMGFSPETLSEGVT